MVSLRSKKDNSINVGIRYLSMTIMEDGLNNYSKSTVNNFFKWTLGKGRSCLHNDIVQKNKAFFIDKIREESAFGNDFCYSIVFKSCKYNHSPKYMSKLDGKERESQKELYEGEKELTHVSIRVRENDTLIAFEINRDGLCFGEFFKTIKDAYKRFGGYGELVFEYLLNENAKALLGKAKRIMAAEVFMDREKLSSEYGLMMKEPENVRKTISIMYKVENGKTFLYDEVCSWLDGMNSKQYSRFRIHIKTEQDADTWIDTDNMFQKDYLVVGADINNVPLSEELIRKMITQLGRHE